jgi:hypothetical protein
MSIIHSLNIEDCHFIDIFIHEGELIKLHKTLPLDQVSLTYAHNRLEVQNRTKMGVKWLEIDVNINANQRVSINVKGNSLTIFNDQYLKLDTGLLYVMSSYIPQNLQGDYGQPTAIDFDRFLGLL